MKVQEGEAEVTLPDGTRLTLRIDHETLILAEDIADVPLNVLLGRLQQGRMGAVRAVLHAALRPHHPAITSKEAASLSFTHFQLLFDGLNEALRRSFPDAAAREAGAEGKGGAPTGGAGGKSSSSNGAKRGSTRKPISR